MFSRLTKRNIRSKPKRLFASRTLSSKTEIKRENKNSRFQIKLRPILIISLIIVFIGAYILLASPTFRVQTILALPDSSVKNENLQIALSHLYRQNIFLIKPEQIKAGIETLTQDIESISLERQLPSTLVIGIYKHPIWGQVSRPDEAISYLLNTAGLIINPQNQEDLPKLKIIVETNRPWTNESQLLQSSDFAYLKQAIEMFEKAFASEVQRARLMEIPAELDLSLANDWKIMLDMKRPVKDQLESLLTVLQQKDLSNRSIKQIDLRIKDKVFIK